MSLIDSYYFSVFIIVCCVSGVISKWREYCATETFHPNCPPGYYVFITYAEFGRMDDGRCITGNYGVLGCATNVEAVLNRMCSGLQRCQVRIPDGRFEVNPSCPRDLRRYLNASYICVPIIDLPEEICHSHGPFELRNDTGFVASRSIRHLSCSPLSFNIHGERGRQVAVSLFDWTQRTSNYRCQSIGVVSDSHRNVSLCAGRSGLVFNSTSERIKVTLTSGQGDFLLKYTITGCPDPVMPSGRSWLRRQGDEALLGCNATKRNWKLTCVHGRWRGEKTYSCPEERSGDEDERVGIDNGNEMSLPQGVSVAIIIGTALVVGVIILVIGLMYLERLRKASNSTASEPDIYLHALMPPGGGNTVEDNKPDVTAYYERTATINKKPRGDLNVHELYGCVHDDVDLQSLKMARRRNDTDENNVRFLTLPVRSILCKNTNIQQASAQKLLDASQLANLPDSAFS